MINKIDSTNFQGRWFGYSKGTPKMRPYRYAEFMPELQYKNPLVEMFKKFGKTIRKTIESIKPKTPKHFDNDSKNIKGTTIEI